MRILANDPGQQLAAQMAMENTRRKRKEGKKSKKEIAEAAKKKVKSETRHASVADGSAVLAPSPAPPPTRDSDMDNDNNMDE